MPRTPVWLRRLLRLRRRGEQGVLRDRHRIEHLATAVDGRDRLNSAYGYFLKVIKRGTCDAEDAGDASTLQMLDGSCEQLATQILMSVSELEAELEIRGYETNS